MSQSAGSDELVRVAVLTEQRALARRQPRGLVRALRAAGHEVAVLVVEDVATWTDARGWSAYDVVVAYGEGAALIGAAYAAAAAGAEVVNPPRALVAARETRGAGAAQPALSAQLRVHGIGGQLHTLRLDEGASARAEPTSPELARLAVAAAALLGLELFAVDLTAIAGGYLVTAVTGDPDYEGVFAADELLARYVAARCRAHAGPARGENRVPA